MAVVQCPTSTRLKAARQLRDITIERLCADLDLDRTAYEKWEEVEDSGGEGAYRYDIPPSSTVVKEIAFYLVFPVKWFYLDEMQLCEPGDISWVSGSQWLDEEFDRILAKAEGNGQQSLPLA